MLSMDVAMETGAGLAWLTCIAFFGRKACSGWQ
jgi:hypothetical protein